MKNRWVVLAAGILIQTVLGGIYAWSTFVPYLNKSYGLDKGQCGFIFGLVIAIFSLAMILAGRVLAKKGPRFTAAIGSVLFMAGYFLASVSKGSYPLLLLSLGVGAGAGIGFGYVCPLSVGMKWFPEKKGLVTGVAVAGFGGGAILLSSIAGHFLQNGMDVLEFFRWFGLFSGALLLAASMLLRDPEEASGTVKVTNRDYSAVFTMPFIVLTIGMFAGTFGGLLIIGNLSPLVISAGLSKQDAILAISLFAIGNAIGRVSWGYAFDYLGFRSIPLSLAAFAVTALLLLFPQPSWIVLTIVTFIGFGFGANFVLYASMITRHFGIEAFPNLYPICFLSYGLAGIIGPGIGGRLADYNKSYDTALIISIAILTFAVLVTTLKKGLFESESDGSEIESAELEPALTSN